MIQEREILEEIQKLRLKTELLANPLYNDFVGSHLWGDIDKRLEQIEKDIETNLKTFCII